jgi:flagellar hook-associated protein 3 FlgL
MSAGRIGSLSLLTNIQRDVGSSQVKLAELQNQISSGYKAPDFAGLDGSVEQFTQVNGQINRTKQYNINNQLNISKLQTADVAISKIVDIADRIKTNIVSGNSANLQSSNLPQIIEDLLVAFGSELNANFNGYYLFGGTDTTNPPVPDTTVTNTVNGQPDDNYYAGAKADATFRVDDRTETAFPVRADDAAFQKIYAAARQAIIAAENNDTEELQRAQQLIQDGQKDLISVRSRLGTSLLNIQAIDDRLKSMTNHWKELTDSVSKTDIVAASTEVASYQSILQASFQVYSRLSQLRLSDYLN